MVGAIRRGSDSSSHCSSVPPAKVDIPREFNKNARIGDYLTADVVLSHPCDAMEHSGKHNLVHTVSDCAVVLGIRVNRDAQGDAQRKYCNAGIAVPFASKRKDLSKTSQRPALASKNEHGVTVASTCC